MLPANIDMTARCPRCDAAVYLAPLVWGEPNPEDFDAAEAGEIALGGCLGDGPGSAKAPTNVCLKCQRNHMAEDWQEQNARLGVLAVEHMLAPVELSDALRVRVLENGPTEIGLGAARRADRSWDIIVLLR